MRKNLISDIKNSMPYSVVYANRMDKNDNILVIMKDDKNNYYELFEKTSWFEKLVKSGVDETMKSIVNIIENNPDLKMKDY